MEFSPSKFLAISTFSFDAAYLERIPFWKRYENIDDIRIPCWSLGRLINIIPSKVKNANLEIFTNTEEKKELLEVRDCGIEFFKTVNHIFYNVEYNNNQFRVSDIGFTEDKLIDGIINMILYLIQNDIIKKVDVKQIFNLIDFKEL